MTSYYAYTAYRPDALPLYQRPAPPRHFMQGLNNVRLPWGYTDDVVPFELLNYQTIKNLKEKEQKKSRYNARFKENNDELDIHYTYNQECIRYAEINISSTIWQDIYDRIKTWLSGSIFFIKLDRYRVIPSRGPIWELNRRTGMVTIFDYDNNGEYLKNGTIGRITHPFHQFDAYVYAEPDQQLLPWFSLHLKHRYENNIIIDTRCLLESLRHSEPFYAFWDFIQNYMDVSRPLPDIPAHEPFRHLDPVTALHDRKAGRNPRYWRDMDEETFEQKLSEMRDKVQNIDTLQRPNIMAKYVSYGT